MTDKPTSVATYDDPKTFPISREAFAEFRKAWREQGPRHRLVDRWRFDLGWNIEPEAVRAWLQSDLETRH